MSQDDIQISKGGSVEGDDPIEPPVRTVYFTRRNALFTLAAAAILSIFIALLSVVGYRYGIFDNYIKGQFVTKMADIGIVFEADVFRVTINPLELELKNATFVDKLTGEKLFFVRNAHLELTVRDLYAWQLSRDISIDKTDVNGAEVWVIFDKDGNSNFSNLTLVEDERGSRVNFKYESVNFSLRDSVIHFGDLSRDLSGNARNVQFLLSPQDISVPDEQKRYTFSLASSESTFSYGESTVEKIDINASGVADRNGAEIHNFELRSPIGESSLSGTLIDWTSPAYDLSIRSSIDLTQASGLFAAGMPIVGVGNFHGQLTGQGESYKIVGEVNTESLRAGGISIKGMNVAATLHGNNSDYDANGTALARMLTFDDFRIDFLRMVGNVRGSGTDFRWLGELQAAAASTPDMTLGGLFLKDALAEYKDEQLALATGSARAQRFAVGDIEFANLNARNLKLAVSDTITGISSSSAEAGSLKTASYGLENVSGRNLQVKSTGTRTDVRLQGLRSRTAHIKDAKFRNVTADDFQLVDRAADTKVIARNFRADRLDVDGTHVEGVAAPQIRLTDAATETIIYSDTLRMARLDTGSAVVGSLNIGGVRLTIRRGRVEARSDDFNAGEVALSRSRVFPAGGNLQDVRISRPVYVLEPSGRYRVTADMSLGGGALGSISLGTARASVDVNNDRIALNRLHAESMNGALTGEAVIAMTNRSQSAIRGDFQNLDIGKLLAINSGRIIPIEGQTTGRVDLTFTGANFRNANGTLNAEIVASAGTTSRGLIPITGTVALTATNGLFNVDQANLTSGRSSLTAAGKFDLRDQNSDLTISLKSDDATEIDRLIRVMNVSPQLEQQLDSMETRLAGKLQFGASVTGNLYDPIIDGRATVESISMRGIHLGSVATGMTVSPLGVELKNGKLQDANGGTAIFSANIPYGGANNTSVNATLTDVNARNLLAALPITLPEPIRDLSGLTSGTVNITGLPNKAQGEVNLSAAKGVVAGQPFDDLRVKAVFRGTSVDLQEAAMRIGAGRLTAKGSFDRISEAFNIDLVGAAVPSAILLAFVPNTGSLPVISGDVDFSASATGLLSRTSSYNVNFSGQAPEVRINEDTLGRVLFKGQTANQILTAELTASPNGILQVISGTVNFGDENLPFTAVTEFNQSPLLPFFAFVPQLNGVPIAGTGTGRIQFGGNLSHVDDQGKRFFSAAGLAGSAQFSQLALMVQDTPLNAAEPVSIQFNTREIEFERVRFVGGGSNMTITGVIALAANGVNNLLIDGRVNLNLLNLAVKDTFFAGYADASIRYSGVAPNARLSGTANIINGSVATFFGANRITIDRLKARLIFTSDQVEIDEAAGYLGGGQFTASGGGRLRGLSLEAFRFSLDGRNVTVPLPQDFITTGDAQLELSGFRRSPGDPLSITIGGRVLARRSLYSQNIDIASIVSGRRDPVLSGGGGGSGMATRFDSLVIEGRDALIVRNNVADLTASVSLVLTGDTNDPGIAGRITANSGTIFFRKERYVVQRGVLEFPPDTGIEPVINLQAETEIAGYQVFVNLAGPLNDSELLTANLRSSPALPQADVVSLVTTGSLTNAAGGIPTLAQTGINTAAEILTDAIINDPIRKATDKLFGLNVFEIDPLISGQQLNPSARLTVGRQINNNLRVTYSTNLSQDQNQVLALEYRVSNKLSLVAQYEQRSLSNVTRNRDNFSFEVRFRKRF
ncbi:MAG: translocation/assembly module TamB domain-containing protein [Pyrinomonadaceae bacterium]